MYYETLIFYFYFFKKKKKTELMLISFLYIYFIFNLNIFHIHALTPTPSYFNIFRIYVLAAWLCPIRSGSIPVCREIKVMMHILH
jgi:hypothetical protein